MATAYMRVLGEDGPPLLMMQDSPPYQIDVPGFGALIVGQVALLGGTGATPLQEWRGLLVQPDDAGRFSKRSNQVERDVVVILGGLEIELLPNSSREERMVVVIEGVDDGQ